MLRLFVVNDNGQNDDYVLVNRGDYLVRPVIQVSLSALKRINP